MKLGVNLVWMILFPWFTLIFGLFYGLSFMYWQAMRMNRANWIGEYFWNW